MDYVVQRRDKRQETRHEMRDGRWQMNWGNPSTRWEMKTEVLGGRSKLKEDISERQETRVSQMTGDERWRIEDRRWRMEDGGWGVGDGIYKMGDKTKRQARSEKEQVKEQDTRTKESDKNKA